MPKSAFILQTQEFLLICVARVSAIKYIIQIKRIGKQRVIIDVVNVKKELSQKLGVPYIKEEDEEENEIWKQTQNKDYFISLKALMKC